LLAKNNSPIEDIKYHLKRAFSNGDSRFQAQFKYARALYITNELQESKEIFKILSNVRMSPDIKNNPVEPIRNNGNLVEFTGTIQKLEISFGFLKRDGTADEIFFSKNETEKTIYSNLKRGDKVKFNIAFNYKGANALNLQKA
jgi:cold shock CspA family protein